MSIAEKIDKIEELVKNIEINHKSDSSDLKTIQILIKEVRKSSEFKKKSNKKSDTESNDVGFKKPTYGITEPKLLPPNVYKFIEEALANKKLSSDFVSSNDIFVNFTTTSLVARTKVNSIIHNYIKTNNLYVDIEKRSIYKPDDKLKELFEMTDKEDLNLKNIQTFLKRAYDKFKVEDNKDKSSSSDEDKKVKKVKKVVKKVVKKEDKDKDDEDKEEDDDSE